MEKLLLVGNFIIRMLSAKFWEINSDLLEEYCALVVISGFVLGGLYSLFRFVFKKNLFFDASKNMVSLRSVVYSEILIVVLAILLAVYAVFIRKNFGIIVVIIYIIMLLLSIAFVLGYRYYKKDSSNGGENAI